MSCELHRQKFFEIMSASGLVSAAELEHVYQQNRHTPTDKERVAVEAKTRSLFGNIAARGLKPPTHSADGLPKAESQPGYAAVYDLLLAKKLLKNALRPKKSSRPKLEAYSKAELIELEAQYHAEGDTKRSFEIARVIAGRIAEERKARSELSWLAEAGYTGRQSNKP
jgi:hypothetical protein